MTAPLLSRVRTIAAKIETTPGTAIAVTADNAAFNVFDPKIQPTFEMAERLEQGGFGRLASSPGGRLGQATFSLELTAPSAQPAWAAAFLPACGMGYTGGVYVLDALPVEAVGSTQETLSIYIYENGLRKGICGAQGNVKFTMTAGKRALAEFTFTGKWIAPTDVAILTPTYPTDPPLRFETSALTVGSWSPAVQELTLDLGNQVYMREDSTQDSGYSYAVIANRGVTGTMNPEAGLVATKDVYGDFLASTEAALSFICRSANDSATFSAGGLQFINPQEGDRNGVQTDEIAFQLNDDDLHVTFDTSASTTIAP